MTAQYRLAWADVRDGILNWQMWSRLGWSDVKGRYRRTLFGPFWATLSLGLFIMAISAVWSRIFNMQLQQFLPYVTAGMLAWTLISMMINEGTAVFAIP